MSSEALEKTVMTDNWQFFPKKLFQNFFHHKKILKATKLQFKIVCRPRVVDKNMPLWYIVTPLPGANRAKVLFSCSNFTKSFVQCYILLMFLHN